MSQQVFTAGGTFTPPAGVTSVDVLVVGGGGGGGRGNLSTTLGGGGGAGGVKEFLAVAVTPGVGVTVTVGGGGAGASVNNTDGANGSGSAFGANTVSGGGGGGAGASSSGGANAPGSNGASGGGGGCSSNSTGSPFAGGTGIGGEGHAGGSGIGSLSPSDARNAGGGGGATGAGSNGTLGNTTPFTTFMGHGGAGTDYSASYGTAFGVSGVVGGGGGGGTSQVPGSGVRPSGGAGGGGIGGTPTLAGGAGTANTGGGGGGSSSNNNGGAGAAGVVVVQWAAPAPGIPTSVSGTPTVEDATLTWAAPASGGAPTSYQVRIDGGAPVTATSPHVFTGLSPATGHDLEVRAVNAAGSSSWVLVHVDTLSGVPTSVSGTPTSTDATLTWAAPVGGTPTSYQVRIDGGAPVTATSPHVFTGLTTGTGYDLEVRAVYAGGPSSWVLVHVDTPDPTEAGYYRVFLKVGPYEWTVSSRDDTAPVDYGPRLPLSLGWSMPDTVEFFPSQADQTTMTFGLYLENAHDIQDVVKGSSVTFNMWNVTDPDAYPWQSFTGIVTQLDAAAVLPDGGFLVTVYATDDTARLGNMIVGYSGAWPQESIGDRCERIATEAGLGFDTLLLGVGLGGTLAARPASPVDALSALRAALKDAADEDSSTLAGTSYYGRHVLSYVRDDDSVAWDATAAADTSVVLTAIHRRVSGEWQDPPDPQQWTVDGCLVEASGQWSKLPGPDGRSWVLVDGTTFGTPSGPPLVRNTSLVDIAPDNSGTAATRDNLGESLVPDGSTFLSGWYARTLRYQAHRREETDPDPMGPAMFGVGAASWAPLSVVIPVVVEDVLPRYDLEDQGYLAGTLTGARMTIPPGGAFYVDIRLRPELLPGMALP